MSSVPLDPKSCYRAVRARDRRFDGTFFVGVRTTGIYCRPICPARTPARERCAFFARAAEAERAGFRACFRCRPELSPGLAPVDSLPRLVRTAAARIDAGFLNEQSVDVLASELGVTSRHLRRAMESEIGVSPVEYAQTRRLALAKQLLHDTVLPLGDVAFASGFASIRRFNALFRQRFGSAPSALRRRVPRREASDAVTLRLDYRPPLDWPTLLDFLRERAILGVETVTEDEYRRTVVLGEVKGSLTVRPAKENSSALVATVSLSLVPKLTEVVGRLRALFDLDAQPHVIAEHLRQDWMLRSLVARRPGLRVPGSFDPFEMAVRAVLGQQVSVRAATTLSGRLAGSFGRATGEHGVLFPSARALSRVSIESMQKIGLPRSRASTVIALARAVEEGAVDLGAASEPESFLERLQRVPGIGPWTAHYLAMRALRWPNAFPASDLGVQKALRVSTARAAEARATHWQPWRAYGVMHLWCSLSDGG